MNANAPTRRTVPMTHLERKRAERAETLRRKQVRREKTRIAA